MDINEMAKKAKSTAWLNRGTYILDVPLSPTADPFFLYLYGATLIIRGKALFDTQNSTVVTGGKIIPIGSAVFNLQSNNTYMSGVQIENCQTFLNETVKPIPTYFNLS